MKILDKNKILSVIILSSAFVLFLLTSAPIICAVPPTFDDAYVCSMHPEIANEGSGQCSDCKMALSKLNGHKSGTPLPSVSNIYASQDNMMYVHEGPGKDPNTGSTLIPITESPIYVPPKPDNHDHSSHQEQEEAEVPEGTLYTCGMHPDVIQEEPGTCPICAMDLTPMKAKGSASSDGSVQIDPVTLQNIGVTTSLVESRDLSVELRSNGIVTIAEDLEYRVNPKVSGWIEKLYVNVTGAEVNKGDALLEIYSPQLVSAQEEYMVAAKNAKLLSGSSLQRVRTTSQNLIESARRRLESWDVSDDQIDELERSGKVKRTLTIFSPASGVVLHKNAVEGGAVKAGMDLFRIVDLNSIWVDAQVFENEMPWVHEGDAVEIVSPYDPDLSMEGHIEYIYPFLDKKTRTAKVRVVVPNSRQELKPDMHVDVRINTRTSKDAVAIPKSALIRSGKRDIVFVAIGEGRFMPNEVKIGLETDDYLEITFGLSAGTKVVTSAQFLLDSESKLQEAIQRRLRQRSEMKKNSQ